MSSLSTSPQSHQVTSRCIWCLFRSVHTVRFPKWKLEGLTLEECDITQMKRISGGSEGRQRQNTSGDSSNSTRRSHTLTIIRPVDSRIVEENSSNTQRGELVNCSAVVSESTFSGAFQGATEPRASCSPESTQLDSY